MKLYCAVTPKEAYEAIVRGGWTEGPHPEHPEDPRRGVLLYPHPPLTVGGPSDVDTILEVEFSDNKEPSGFLWDDDDDAGYMIPVIVMEVQNGVRALSTRTVRAGINRLVAAHRKELRALGVKPTEASARSNALRAVLRHWEEADGTYNGVTLAKIRP